MDIPSQTIIDALTFLLPGFITAALLYSLTPAPRPIPFERVVQALIFTVVIQAAAVGVETSLIGIGSRFVSIGVWSDQTKIAWSIAEGEWLVDGRRVPLEGVERILIRVQDVEMVELMQVVEAADSAAEKSNGRS